MKRLIAIACCVILTMGGYAADKPIPPRFGANPLLEPESGDFFNGSIGFRFGDKSNSQLTTTYVKPKDYTIQGGCKFFGVLVGGKLTPPTINYPKKSKDVPPIVWGQTLPSPQKWVPPSEEPRFYVKNKEMFQTINEIGVILRFNSVGAMKDAATYYGQYFGMFDADFTAKNPPTSMGQASGRVVMVQAPFMFENKKTGIAQVKLNMGDFKHVVYIETNSREQTVAIRVVDESV